MESVCEEDEHDEEEKEEYHAKDCDSWRLAETYVCDDEDDYGGDDGGDAEDDYGGDDDEEEKGEDLMKDCYGRKLSVTNKHDHKWRW